jgi:hypothetical protein
MELDKALQSLADGDPRTGETHFLSIAFPQSVRLVFAACHFRFAGHKTLASPTTPKNSLRQHLFHTLVQRIPLYAWTSTSDYFQSPRMDSDLVPPSAAQSGPNLSTVCAPSLFFRPPIFLTSSTATSTQIRLLLYIFHHL